MKLLVEKLIFNPIAAALHLYDFKMQKYIYIFFISFV